MQRRAPDNDDERGRPGFVWGTHDGCAAGLACLEEARSASDDDKLAGDVCLCVCVCMCVCVA